MPFEIIADAHLGPQPETACAFAALPALSRARAGDIVGVARDLVLQNGQLMPSWNSYFLTMHEDGGLERALSGQVPPGQKREVESAFTQMMVDRLLAVFAQTAAPAMAALHPGEGRFAEAFQIAMVQGATILTYVSGSLADHDGEEHLRERLTQRVRVMLAPGLSAHNAVHALDNAGRVLAYNAAQLAHATRNADIVRTIAENGVIVRTRPG